MKTLPLLFLAIVLALPSVVFGQPFLKRTTLLPKDRLFQPILLDPTEAQAFGSVVAFRENNEPADLIYLPFAFGFYKGLARWGNEGRSEFGFDVSAHTQFEWTFVEGVSERNMRNVDYRVSCLFHHRVDEWQSFRIRFFHVSSHLGDDYMIRNGISSYFPNPTNYEQLDFLWSFTEGGLRYYGGAGMVVRPETIRKRFSAQAGFFYEKGIPSKWPLGFFGGADLKLMAEHDFNPGLKVGAGLRVGEPRGHPVRFMIEFFRGNLPYSPLESSEVAWLGMGVYFSP